MGGYFEEINPCVLQKSPAIPGITIPTSSRSSFTSTLRRRSGASSSKIADQTQARVLGHDEGPNGSLTAHVACTSEVVARRLTDRWSI